MADVRILYFVLSSVNYALENSYALTVQKRVVETNRINNPGKRSDEEQLEEKKENGRSGRRNSNGPDRRTPYSSIVSLSSPRRSVSRWPVSFHEKTTGISDRVLTKLSPTRMDKGETIQWDD